MYASSSTKTWCRIRKSSSISRAVSASLYSITIILCLLLWGRICGPAFSSAFAAGYQEDALGRG
jgi:hypothetical protein